MDFEYRKQRLEAARKSAQELLVWGCIFFIVNILWWMTAGLSHGTLHLLAGIITLGMCTLGFLAYRHNQNELHLQENWTLMTKRPLREFPHNNFLRSMSKPAAENLIRLNALGVTAAMEAEVDAERELEELRAALTPKLPINDYSQLPTLEEKAAQLGRAEEEVTRAAQIVADRWDAYDELWDYMRRLKSIPLNPQTRQPYAGANEFREALRTMTGSGSVKGAPSPQQEPPHSTLMPPPAES